MPHSPEVLRSFYLIALSKDLNTTYSLADSAQQEVVAGDNVGLSKENSRLPTLPGRSPRCEPGEESEDGDTAHNTLNSEHDIVNLELNLGGTESGSPQLKSFLNKSRVTWNDSACQQCRLHDLRCDLQRPSCWKCQRYSMPCFYEHEGVKNYQQESHIESEAESISWQDSIRENPYQNLEGNGKLYRIDRRHVKARRSRLSKPIPREKRVLYDLDGDLRTEKEELLGRSSPSISEPDMESRPTSPTRSESDIASSRTASPTRSVVVTELQATSPTDWMGSEMVRSFSRPNSSYSSGYTTSLASTESSPTGSSPRCSLTIRTTPPTTGSSSTWLPPSGDAPRPFQCTFCLYQCEDQEEWEQHEVLQHSPRRIWICMPWGPVENTNGNNVCVFCGVSDPDPDHFSQHEAQQCYRKKRKDRTFISKDALQQHLTTVHNHRDMTRRMQKWSRSPKDKDWYWNCGFCDEMLPSWTDRVVHIGVHFKEGAVMSSWDPLKPSYPLDRKSLNCVAWFPPLGWDAKTLWDLECKRNGFSWAHDVLEEQFRCSKCDIDVYFRSQVDAERHEIIWHSRREVWSCPTINDIKAGILAPYFFPTEIRPSLSDDGSCPYCKKSFDKLTKVYRGLDNWDARVRHLEFDHNFDGCEPVCKSTNAGAILLHLANIHDVTLTDTTVDVLESCRRDEARLAKKLKIPSLK